VETIVLGRPGDGDVEGHLASQRPGIEAASMRTQLLCLPVFLGDPELAGRVAHGWGALARACHPRTYELAPTAQEQEQADGSTSLTTSSSQSTSGSVAAS
jgi:hypothetical protein